MTAEVLPGRSPARDRGTRSVLLAAAGRLLAGDPRVPLAVVASAAGVSRATLYRHFRSRSQLLSALELEPDPGTRSRVLAAAADLVGRHGLRDLSMDTLASIAGVSRASVYRLFPGKPALFSALVAEYSPFEAVERTLAQMGDRPPEEVLPEVARVAAATVQPRIGIARSLIFEVTGGSPDAIEGAAPVLRNVLGALGGYLTRQMAAGRLRPIHPLLAAQALIGPIAFHLMTRTIAEQMVGLDVPLDAAVTELAEAALRGLAVTPAEEDSR